MSPYPMELRRRILADCDAGMNTLAVAVKHDVSPAWVRHSNSDDGKAERSPRARRSRRSLPSGTRTPIDCTRSFESSPTSRFARSANNSGSRSVCKRCL